MKSGRPVLYELLKTPPQQPQHHHQGGGNQNGHAVMRPVEPAAAPPVPQAEEPERAVRAAGRTIRLPAGYLFVFAALLILCGAAAYMFGYMRGEAEGELSELDRMVAEQEDEIIGSQLAGAGDGAGRGSSDADGGTDRGRQPGAGSSGNTNSRTGGPRGGGSPSSTSPRAYATAVEPSPDPREPEHYYYRLIQTTRKNARGVAEFCREHGVEAFIIRANNSDQFAVYVMPGFAPDERQSPAATALVDALDNVRTKWRLKYDRDELRDYFAALYRGN